MKSSSPFRAGLLACALATSATVALDAAEIEVFHAHPPEEGKARSGFDEKAMVRIEPADGKSLHLNLRDLPAHQFLKIETDIEIQATPGMEIELLMMGEDREIDPKKMQRSRLQISVDGGKPAIDSSFSGYMGVGGSFPDFEGEFLHLPGTGSAFGAIKVDPAKPADIMGLMGDFDLEKMRKLSRHTISFIVPHSAPNATIDFAWKTPKGPLDPAGAVGLGFAGGGSATPFSITALKASTLDSPSPLDEAGFAKNFEALGGSDPVNAIEALNLLVAAGHEILPRLRTKLARKPDPDLDKKFADALAAMDDPSFETRAKASKSLTDLGNAVIPLARQTLAEKGEGLSIETKSALTTIAGQLENGDAATAESIRTNRLHRLLGTLGGKDAEALKASLPEPKIVVAPEIGTMVTALKTVMGGGVEMGFPPDGDPGAPFAPEEAPIPEEAPLPEEASLPAEVDAAPIEP